MRAITLAAAGAVVALAGAMSTQAQTVSVVPPGGRVADLVRVAPGAETVYVAGQTADPISSGEPKRYGDTQTQTVSILRKIQGLLKDQGFSMEDVVMMRVALLPDPAKGGVMDFAGMNAGYAQFFGATRNKPARMTTQVAALVEPGALVEIEVQAARAPKAR